MLRTSAVAVLLLASRAVPAATAPCTSLTQNILTSQGCPSRCDSNPCVLYSPSQATQCPVASGRCATDDAFIPPAATSATAAAAPCSLSYQCLGALVDATTKTKWSISLAKEAVTQVSKLSYPSNTDILTVDIDGSTSTSGNNATSTKVLLDESIFVTPDSVIDFQFSGVNLSAASNFGTNFSKRKWQNVTLANDAFDLVPSALASLKLRYVDLSDNAIKSIVDATPFVETTTLRLEHNGLTDLTIDLPAINTLNLTGNPLTKIPDKIFTMKTLQTLSIRESNIANLALTMSQVAFLSKLVALEANLTATNCSSNSTSVPLPHGAGAVCLPSDTGSATPVPTTPVGTPSSSQPTLIVIVIAISASLAVAFVIFRLFTRRTAMVKEDPLPYVYDGNDPLSPTPLWPDYCGAGTHSGTRPTGIQTATDTYQPKDGFIADKGNYAASNLWNDPGLLALRLESAHLRRSKLISVDANAEVWDGYYNDQHVAIKKLTGSHRNMANTLAFATTIKSLALLQHHRHHANLVHLVGAQWTNSLDFQVVTEFVDKGDLRSVLQSPEGQLLTWEDDKCGIAIDVANALVFLHSQTPKIILRDLHSSHVLLDANKNAKVATATSRPIRAGSVLDDYHSTGEPTLWLAPELLAENAPTTEQVDIYAFGVLLAELDTTTLPFGKSDQQSAMALPMQVAQGKLKPTFSEECPEAIEALAKLCLSRNPKERPSAVQLVYKLSEIQKYEL